MITKPTALILGAGASMPYGFPSGQGLLTTIDKNLNKDKLGSHPNPDWIAILKDFGISDGDIQIFRQELFYSRISVDAFLEHRPEFLKVGKLVIALSLIQYENNQNLFPDILRRQESWYDYLRGKLNAPFGDFDKNKLSVITFNYDRSIEHYLFMVLKNTYGKSDEECAEKLNSIPIIHVHGRLGALPWLKGTVRPYTNKINVEEVKVAGEQIIVISEGIDTSPEFEEAFKIMMSADKIYFLGFGYNDVNLRRLGVKKLNKNYSPKAHGTGYGLGRAERRAIESKWDIRLGDDHQDVLHFLKNNALLE